MTGEQNSQREFPNSDMSKRSRGMAFYSGGGGLVYPRYIPSSAYRRRILRVRKRQRLGYQSGRMASTMTGRRGELKAYDVATNAYGFIIAGNFNLLNAMTQGADLFQRIGRKVYMKSLHIRGYILPQDSVVAGSTGQDIGRIIVVYDAQPNAAAPLYVSLLGDSNAAAGVSALSEINLSNRERFKILKDHIISLPSVVTSAIGEVTLPGFQDPTKDYSIDWFIPLKGLEACYNGTNGGTIADITSGSIYVFLASTNFTNNWQFVYHTRLRFYDT